MKLSLILLCTLLAITIMGTTASANELMDKVLDERIKYELIEMFMNMIDEEMKDKSVDWKKDKSVDWKIRKEMINKLQDKTFMEKTFTEEMTLREIMKAFIDIAGKDRVMELFQDEKSNSK